LRGGLTRLESYVGTLGETIFVFQLLIRLSLSVRRLRRTKVPALVVRHLALFFLLPFQFDFFDVLDSAYYDVDFSSIFLFVRWLEVSASSSCSLTLGRGSWLKCFFFFLLFPLLLSFLCLLLLLG
jgi:hypothetical protein